MYPVALVLAASAIWLVTALYSRRLLRRFCSRFPTVAQQEIPFAFDRQILHPKKATFFFSNRAKEIAQSDPQVLRIRRRFIGWCVASALVPLAGLAAIAVVAFVEMHK